MLMGFPPLPPPRDSNYFGYSMKQSPLLSVQNLTVRFHADNSHTDVVNNVSFDLYKGEILALVGESGSGKSMIARSILRLLPYPGVSHPNSHIFFKNDEILTTPFETIRVLRGKSISMVFQEPMSALNPLHTIGKQISEVLMIHQKLTKKKALERAIELLALVKIDAPEKRLSAYPSELSGGQRQRVVIAIAIANNPEILIADEPTTALDVTVQAKILALLIDIQKTTGMSILLITHDLNLVKKVAHRVLVMKSGALVESGSTKLIFEQATHPYTKMLIDSEPTGLPKPITQDAKQILSVQRLSVRFPVYKGILRRVDHYFNAVLPSNLSLHEGESLGIVGESGSGKSSLAFAILRLIKSEGAIILNNTDINQLKQKALQPIRKNLQIVFQDPYGSLNPRFSIKDIICEGLKVHESQLQEQEIEWRVKAALEEVGLTADMLYRYPHEFSGGQRQRIAIARALILQPKLIVLDEPTSALDRSMQTQIIELLHRLQAKYQMSYLFISHDLKVIRAMCHRVMVMQQGQIIETGETEAVFSQPQQAYTQQLLQASF